MYLLDTDTLIYTLKGEKTVVQNIARHVHDPIKTTVITLMELYYGAYKSQNKNSNLSKIKTLTQFMEILPVGPETVEIFGLLKADLESGGTRLDDFDLIIASIAMAHNQILVTNNEKHFKRINGLKMENWIKAS